jgi:hypothetical protein
LHATTFPSVLPFLLSSCTLLSLQVLREAFEAAVVKRMMSDVPFGACTADICKLRLLMFQLPACMLNCSQHSPVAQPIVRVVTGMHMHSTSV